MATASQLMARAVELVEKGLASPAYNEANRAISDRTIAAASVYAQLAATAERQEFRAEMDARLIGEAMAPDQDPPTCTCSPRGAETHQIGCEDTT